MSASEEHSHEAVRRVLSSLATDPGLPYCSSILHLYDKTLVAAKRAKTKGLDMDPEPMSQEVCDMGDRLEVVSHVVGIADRFRQYPPSLGLYELSFKVAEDIALGHFGFFEKEQVLNLSAKCALSIVTSGVSAVFPADITNVVIKKNGDGTSYPALVFGQITGLITPVHAAFLVLLIDRVRLTLGLDKFHVNSLGDDEIARTIEEVSIYERESGSARPHFPEDSIRLVLQNIPVEIDGSGTEETEVMINRDLQRIASNRIRGGAVYVLTEGILDRPSTVLSMAKSFQIPEWDWLADLMDQEKTSLQEDITSYILNARPGKPVLSLPGVPGSFRLRYGRAENSGFGSFGLHPTTLELLDFPLSTGTQIKVSFAGKTGSVAVVDSIRPPLVRLRNGDVCRVDQSSDIKSVKERLDVILDLGDILVSPSEFISSANRVLEPSGYVEEWWISDLQSASMERHLSPEQLSDLVSIDLDKLHATVSSSLRSKPSFLEAMKLSSVLGIPLHPSYTYLWDILTIKDIFSLREGVVDFREVDMESASLTLITSPELKHILEMAGIPHKLSGGFLIVEGDDARAVYFTLVPDKQVPLGATYPDTLTLLKFLSGLEIKKKSSLYVGVAMRKTEIASERKMRPPVHVLFPTGIKSGPNRDILQLEHAQPALELNMKLCSSCQTRSPYDSCPFCGTTTSQLYYCPTCRKERFADRCPDCQGEALEFMTTPIHISDLLRAASEEVGLQSYPPLKGVTKLINKSRIAERLEKGILRQRHNLTCFKDGTIRYDTVNAPLTHFKPSQFGFDVKRLQGLGYLNDRFGNPLESEDQVVELKPQDVILPQDSSDHLRRLGAFLDDLLSRFYKTETFYNVQTSNELVGTLIVGISPKSSIGVVGRIMGFTNARVLYSHPSWHAAKHRDCGGDVDSFTLLMDVLLNYSPKLCPNHITGLIDVPVMLEPIVLPALVNRRPSSLDAVDSYPQSFYTASKDRSPVRVAEESVRASLEPSRQTGISYRYSHWSASITSAQPRSLYSIPGPMPDKVSRQIAIASRIQATNVDGLVSSLLNNYLVKEILQSLDAYSTQTFHCKGCGEVYRRPPLKGSCLTCGREVVPSLTLAAVEKYVLLAKELVRTHNVAQPIRDKVTLTLDNLQLLTESKKQTSIADYT